MEIEVVRKLLPKELRHHVTQEFLDRVCASVNDTEIAESFRDNFVSFASVLREGRFKFEDYINAVKFVSYKLSGMSDYDAYAVTFPDRYGGMVREGKSSNYISGFVSGYSKTKLVVRLLEQSMIPIWVLNAPLHQEALNTLAEMIRSPNVKGMAKVKACEAILNYTKPPEVQRSELKIDVNSSDTINELREAADRFAESLRNGLGNGVRLREIAERPLVAEIVDEDAEDCDEQVSEQTECD